MLSGGAPRLCLELPLGVGSGASELLAKASLKLTLCRNCAKQTSVCRILDTDQPLKLLSILNISWLGQNVRFQSISVSLGRTRGPWG